MTDMTPEEAAKLIEDTLCYLHRLPKDRRCQVNDPATGGM